jgi:hemolysin III
MSSAVMSHPAILATAQVERCVLARPSWRGRLHAWAAGLSLPAGIQLIARAERTAARVAAIVYVCSLVLVFATSAAYHRLACTDRSRAVMRRLDHAMIFVLIAGTYAPICVVALPTVWGVPMLCAVSTVAAIGVALKLVAFDRLRWLGYALYPILGWAALLTAPVMADALTGAEMALVVAGGLAYSLGFPVLLLHRPNPWPSTFGYHEIWHVCTVVAAGCHFAAIAGVVT